MVVRQLALGLKRCSQSALYDNKFRMSEPVKELDEVDGVVKIVEKGPAPLVKLKKDKGKKKTEPEIKHEVEGGEVKFLCDKCSYKGPSTTSADVPSQVDR